MNVFMFLVGWVGGSLEVRKGARAGQGLSPEQSRPTGHLPLHALPPGLAHLKGGKLYKSLEVRKGARAGQGLKIHKN